MRPERNLLGLFGFLFALSLSALTGCTDGYCDPGTAGCPCLEEATCRSAALMCSSDRCVARPGAIPENPVCYTPCQGSFTDAEGVYRSCSPEGLMEGCLANAVCSEGTCVPAEMIRLRSAAGAVGVCSTDAECPDFQACIANRCFSNCEDDAGCSDGQACSRHVCRDRCDSSEQCPTAEQVCIDSVCKEPTGNRFDRQSPSHDAPLEVDQETVVFTSNVSDTELLITNPSDRAVMVDVRKSEQRSADVDGNQVTLRADDGESPLPWLRIGTAIPSAIDGFEFLLAPGASTTVYIDSARNPSLSAWSGALEISAEGSGVQRVGLSYADAVDGRWSGTVHYFGNFEDGSRPETGDYPLDDWMADRSNVGIIDQVPNAFMQAWARFRNNAFSLPEMQALVSATLEESWNRPRVRELCEEAGYGQGAACAPYGGSGSASVLLYTSSEVDNPVPSGGVEMPFAMNIREATPTEISGDPRCGGDPFCFLGRIESGEALQYAGDPSLAIVFGSDPSLCESITNAGCTNTLTSLDADMAIGGRYLPDVDDSACSLVEGLDALSFPFLPLGFNPAGVEAGISGGPRTRTECRDARVPFFDGSHNARFAGSNPVPDGLPRRRHLELVDAQMVEQHIMVLILRELTDPFHGGSEPIVTYAYAVLEREPLELEPADYLGQAPMDDRTGLTSVLEVACDPDLIRPVIGRALVPPIENLSKPEITALARAVIRGDTSAVGDLPPPSVEASGDETVHYLCVWREEAEDTTGNLDPTEGPPLIQREVFGAGPDGVTSCPSWGTVIYFTLDQSVFGENYDLAGHACNGTIPETCLSTLETWAAQGNGIRMSSRDLSTFTSAAADVPFDLAFQCQGATLSDCPYDPLDRLDGKHFFSVDAAETFFHPIEADIREAFRYRTQFESRTGATVGFAPTICTGSSSLSPYCYNPELIEEVQSRADCALAIYHHHLDTGRFNPGDSTDAATLDTLRLFLRKSFSLEQSYDAYGDVSVEYGLERLNSELLIMLGDEAYTESFASRFDLAGANQLVFEGAEFEQGGVTLTGAVGYELYRLYQATQYYGMVLDRFYEMSPLLWASLDEPQPEQYLSEATVTTYLDRVTRASTQTASSWSEVARRYQAINRPDLARTVLERAYTRAFQESMILTGMMTAMTRSVSPAGIAGVRTAIEDSQRRYRIALVTMAEAYQRITSEVNYFGMSPDYIPFPAIHESGDNGFDVLFARATDKMEAASDLEMSALEDSRDFDVDEVAFQAELVDIRNGYEAELGALCGTFVGTDGRVYPALPRYAHLSPDLAGLDDPCGMSGGALWEAFGDIQTEESEVRRVRTEIQHLLAETSDGREWVQVQCDRNAEEVDRFLTDQRAVDNLSRSIDQSETAIAQLDKIHEFITGLTERINDSADCKTPWCLIGKTASNGAWVASAGIHFATTLGIEISIDVKQNDIRDRERQYEAWTIGRECSHLRAELGFTLRGLQRDMDLAELDMLQVVWNTQVATSRLRELANERRRLEGEWDEVQSLAVDAAAAQTDPNIRIYKNDAIINADRSFTRAIAEAYRATRVFEYYTAQSYAHLDELFLIRMVNYGDHNLRNYLAELQEAIFEFEFEYGNPDTRVATISMRDDVLQIPRYSDDGLERILSDEERTDLFRAALQDPSRRNEEGMLTIEFPTTFDELSPITVNHKILFLEAEIYGDVGDDIGRIYLRQEGTGVIRTDDGSRTYYTFPPRTAVVNPIFNGERTYAEAEAELPGPNESLYRSFRFRERPFVQTRWLLTLNQVTDQVNEDINLAGLDDIRIQVYYTDFTP